MKGYTKTFRPVCNAPRENLPEHEYNTTEATF